MPAKKQTKQELMPERRVVRFSQSFYHPEYGLYEKDTVHTMPDDIVLPKRGVEYIEGAPDSAPTSELAPDEAIEPARRREDEVKDPRTGKAARRGKAPAAQAPNNRA